MSGGNPLIWFKIRLMNHSELTQILKGTPVTEFRYFNTIGSTNDEALSWVDIGAPDFGLVIADEQTKGRGRFARRWVTNPSSSLAFSLILHPNREEIIHLALFAPLCGLVLRETLHSLFGLNAEIKWPNDVLLATKKTAGVLVEATWCGAEVAGIILGIGINISNGSLPPQNAQLFPATFLEEQLENPVDRLLLLKELLNSLAKWRKELGTAVFFTEWQKHLAFKDQLVRIEESQKTSIIGRVKGIDSQGNLVLTLENGTEQDFSAGDVHLRPFDM